LLVGLGVNYIVIGEKVMATKEKGRQWDGVSRPSDDKYRREFNRIFSKKDIKEIEKIVDEHEEKKMYQELAKKIGVPVDELEGYEKE
jgi:hypothetical protein